ncbi:MAG: carbohydrate ABC transporter permease [Anaerolineae bacterium]
MPQGLTAVSVGVNRRGTLRSRLLRREMVDGYLFMSPWFLGFLLFTAGPMIASALLSFMKYEIVVPPKWTGTYNYVRLFRDSLFYKSLANTAYYTFLAVPLQLTVALLMALMMNLKLKFINVFRTMYYMPSIVPIVASVLLWMWIFNPEFGLANSILARFGIRAQAWFYDPKMVKNTFIIMSLWGVGGQMIIYLAGLQGIPEHLYEAAKIDGAGTLAMFRRITIPMLSPTIFFNLIMGIIGSFQVFTSAFIATNGGPKDESLFYVLYLYRNAWEFWRMGYACAMAWILFVIVLTLTLVQFRLANVWVYYEGEAPRT